MAEPKRILATDIGGTNARFAEATIGSLGNISMSEPVVFPTWSDSVDSFESLLGHYVRSRPGGGHALEHFDALAVAVAGAVSGRRASLPNIPWDIDLTKSQPLPEVYLLNDFYAQAHGYLEPDIFDRLYAVRPGKASGPGSIAIVGAGTGLGHAALKPEGERRVVIASEAGHVSFSFHGLEEQKIEAFLLARCGKPYLSGDDVISGSGLALLHEFITGQAVSPAEALAEQEESLTRSFYARFYARACRNYCLTMHPVEALVVSGGIAAKNPQVIESAAFFEEFDNGRSYRHLLERIPIYLNRDETLGLRGAAVHAWLQVGA